MKKKLDKFVILGLISLLLSILLNPFLHLELLQDVMHIYSISSYYNFAALTFFSSIIFSILFSILAVIFSGISIKRIDNFNLKGKVLVITIFAISILALSFWIFSFYIGILYQYKPMPPIK